MDHSVFPLKLKDAELLRTQSYIDGKWVDAQDDATFAVDNPATGEIIAHVANLDEGQTEQAIAAAERAFPLWRARTAKERAGILRKWFDLILANGEDLAALMTLEQGKPVAEARGEVAYAASFVEWFAEQAKRVMGDTLASTSPNTRMLVLREPIGVCAAITPWNFPLAMITRKVAPAIAAGCTIVLKPAEQTPLSALALAELAERAGIPAGVLNIVTADSERSIKVGKALCASPVVRKLTFTGSTPVGRILMQQSAPTIKKLSLELGGNAPFIVFDDADLDAAVEGAIISKYRNAGQTCVCANRIYVQASVAEAFTEKFVAKARTLKLGRGTEEGVTMGPLIDERAVAKMEEHVADALAKGGKLVLGGKRSELGGTFFEPTVMTGITQDMKVAKEETFAPLAPIITFRDDEEVIAMANDTEFGLAAYFYAKDMARVWRVAEALESGMVGVNTGLLANEMAPFGGVKQSGLGREGSKYGIEGFLELKYVCLGGM